MSKIRKVRKYEKSKVGPAGEQHESISRHAKVHNKNWCMTVTRLFETIDLQPFVIPASAQAGDPASLASYLITRHPYHSSIVCKRKVFLLNILSDKIISN